jgi:hypothetical protein
MFRKGRANPPAGRKHLNQWKDSGISKSLPNPQSFAVGHLQCNMHNN